MRKFFVKLCKRGNTVVTYMPTARGIEVTFEQAVYNGFNSLILTIDGRVLEVEGFNPSEVAYFQLFLKRNKDHIKELVMENA